MSAADRGTLLDRGYAQLSVRRQCTLLGLARSGVYRAKPAHDAEDLALSITRVCAGRSPRDVLSRKETKTCNYMDP